MAEKLDEAALRREGFTEGIRVRLADGQEWALPAFSVRSYPQRDPNWDGVHRRPGDGFRCVHEVWYGRDCEDAWDRAVGGKQPEGGAERIAARLELAARLLAKNYAIPDEALPGLLAFDTGDPESFAMLAGLTDAFVGIGPAPAMEAEADRVIQEAAANG